MSKDLIITLPRSTVWAEYARELAAVADRSALLNFRVPTAPRQTAPGARVYLVYKGQVIGWQEYVGTERHSFTCMTLGREWSEGWYVQRTGRFHYLETPIPLKGFQSFRYAPDDWRSKPERPDRATLPL